MVRIKRNEPCPCNSGKKYKKCCIGKDIKEKETNRQRIIYGDEYSNPEIEQMADNLKQRYPDHQVIDVSNVADNSTYKPLQLQHFKKKVIMLLSRNKTNDDVFVSRCPEHINIMILYHGAYQCVADTDEVSMKLAYDMIDTRINGDVWQEN